MESTIELKKGASTGWTETINEEMRTVGTRLLTFAGRLKELDLAQLHSIPTWPYMVYHGARTAKPGKSRQMQKHIIGRIGSYIRNSVSVSSSVRR